MKNRQFRLLEWFLGRVSVIWLILTVAMIAGVLHSILKAGGFN